MKGKLVLAFSKGLWGSTVRTNQNPLLRSNPHVFLDGLFTGNSLQKQAVAQAHWHFYWIGQTTEYRIKRETSSFPRIQLVSRKEKWESEQNKFPSLPYSRNVCFEEKRNGVAGSGEDGGSIAFSVLITVGFIMATVVWNRHWHQSQVTAEIKHRKISVTHLSAARCYSWAAQDLGLFITNTV